MTTDPLDPNTPIPPDPAPADPTPAPADPTPAAPAPAPAPAPATGDGSDDQNTDPAPSYAAGDLVSWETAVDGSDAVSVTYGLVVEPDVELGRDAEGVEQSGVRIALLGDLQVLDGEQLKAL